MCRTWQKLKEVLKNWLQSSEGEGETKERNDTCQELAEVGVTVNNEYMIYN